MDQAYIPLTALLRADLHMKAEVAEQLKSTCLAKETTPEASE